VRLPKTLYSAALLINAYPHRPLLLELFRGISLLCNLQGCFDIARKQDEAAELKLSGDIPKFDWDRRAVKACHDKLTDSFVETSRHN
jgi:hypothetical protein